jgi:hypothetical protein
MQRMLVLAAAAILVSACGGGSKPSAPTNPSPGPSVPQNRAPSVTATGSPAFGIDSLTQFVFRANGSDPDGDPVTYRWTLSDGSSGDGMEILRVYVGGGTVNATVTASDGRMSATAQTSITVGSMTGKWRLNPTLYPGWLWDFNLKQTGATITGTFVDNEYGAGRLDPAELSLIDERGRIRMRTKQGVYGDVYVEGTMDKTGRRITGQLRGSGITISPQPFVMNKLGS